MAPTAAEERRAGGRGAREDQLVRRDGGGGAGGAERLEDVAGRAVEAEAEDAPVGEAAGQLGGREERDEAPFHEDGEAVGEALHVAEVVRREEDRLSLAAPPLGEGVEGREPLGVERGRRLVEEEDAAPREAPRPRGRAAGPFRRSRSTRPGRPRRSGTRSGGPRPSGARARRGGAGRTPTTSRPVRASGKATFCGRKERARRAAGSEAGRPSTRTLPDVGVDEARGGLEAGRLSRTVRPEERDDLSRLDREGDVGDGDVRRRRSCRSSRSGSCGRSLMRPAARRPKTRSAEPRRNVIEEAATAGTCAARADGLRGAGRRGGAGGRASGAWSIAVGC